MSPAARASRMTSHASPMRRSLEVVDRHPGSSTTDFWGIVHFPAQVEQEPMTPDELERRLALLRAAWAYFDDVAGRVSAELAKGPRGGGRSRDEIVVHVYASERHNWWRKVGLRPDDEALLAPEELAAYRADYLDRIRAFHAEGKPARTWPLAFLIRRTAQHVMDHAWELEDRDLTNGGRSARPARVGARTAQARGRAWRRSCGYAPRWSWPPGPAGRRWPGSTALRP